MKPFLKWAGGKYRIIDRIRSSLPSGNRLIEPFAGSGAVFLNTDYEQYLVSDLNPDLISLFNQVKEYGQDFILEAESLFGTSTNEEAAFYSFREEFNSTADLSRKAALFIYLNRHCFNGLCRYNSKGGFNVPFGRYSSPSFPMRELLYFSQKSQSVTFKVCSFEVAMRDAIEGDIVYCDPPYVPLTSTSNFTDYTKEGFGKREQELLAHLALGLMQRGIPVVISNHDTPFTRAMYSVAKITAFQVQRFISRDADNRGKASELIALFA